MAKKRVLVTGGAGFIGSNFCNLNKDRYEIVALDNLFLGDPKNLHPDITFIKGDACKEEDLAKCGDHFDVVLHFAGTSSAPMFEGEALTWGYVNAIESFFRTLEFARKHGAKKFLYASTSSLYGNQNRALTEDLPVQTVNHYSVTKRCYERGAACYHRVYPEMDIYGFRFMSVYGPNEEAKGRYANMISQFLWDIARDLPPVIFGDGSQTRDFTFVEDIVQAMVLAIEAPVKGENYIYNIGTGKCTAFNDIIQEINKALGKDIQPIYIPNPVKEGYIASQHADISKIKRELGYEPKVSLQEGIARLVDQLDVDKIKETSSDLLRDKYC